VIEGNRKGAKKEGTDEGGRGRRKGKIGREGEAQRRSWRGKRRGQKAKKKIGHPGWGGWH